MAFFWSKESEKIKEKIDEKKAEIKECGRIKSKISAINGMLASVPGKLSSAHSQFYGGGYIDNGQSIDADQITGSGKSRINALTDEVNDIIERINTLVSNISQLVTKKEAELKTLETQYKQALAKEAKKNS